MFLKRGDKSEEVELLQTFLNANGYAVGAVDGDFGAKTELALQRWQLANGLDADGMFGAASLEKAKAQDFGILQGTFEEKKSDKLILVSAGHGANDPGAVGNGFVEAKEALKIRDEVARILRGKGCSVLEDGADGVNEPLKKALVLASRADTAVEFHFNAASNPKATGIEVLAKPKYRKLAQDIAKAISGTLKLSLRGGDFGYKADNSGQHHRLAFCERGGLIVEVCFISNPSDMKAYSDNFDAMCGAIADVLAK